MSGRIDTRLNELSITLPKAAPPVASYVPYVISGNLVFISGQVTMGPQGLEYIGQLGKEFTVEQGQAAARLCALNIIAQLREACAGNLDRVKRCVKVTGFVNAVQGFAQHPEVINGASDTLVQVFGDAGRHVRAAVGAGSLPRNVAVEVEAIFEIA
ncbi:MAG: RidA family protein [Alphaproteobacteria bacterium]